MGAHSSKGDLGDREGGKEGMTRWWLAGGRTSARVNSIIQSPKLKAEG